MRIYLHDYGGHAFLVGLARHLARRGHTVRYGFSATNEAPQGDLAPRPDDPATFSLDPVVAPAVDKRARSLVGLITSSAGRGASSAGRPPSTSGRWEADVVVCANGSLDVVGPLMDAARSQGAAFVNWLQDVLSVGARSVLTRRFGPLGSLVGRTLEAKEGRMLRGADAVIGITVAFRPLLDRWGVDPERVAVIENWAPLADLPRRPRDTDWARAHGLDGHPVVLYSGTLGMKHDPAGLGHLAGVLADRPPRRAWSSCRRARGPTGSRPGPTPGPAWSWSPSSRSRSSPTSWARPTCSWPCWSPRRAPSRSRRRCSPTCARAGRPCSRSRPTTWRPRS